MRHERRKESISREESILLTGGETERGGRSIFPDEAVMRAKRGRTGRFCKWCDWRIVISVALLSVVGLVISRVHETHKRCPSLRNPSSWPFGTEFCHDATEIDPNRKDHLVPFKKDRQEEGGVSGAVDGLAEQILLLAGQLREQRDKLGEASCALKGVGPTGGVCLRGRRNKFKVDVPLAQSLCYHVFTQQIAPDHDAAKANVLDLGCGMGQYEKILKECKGCKGLKWRGFDGSEDIENATHGQLKWADLSKPLLLGTPSDAC